MKTKPAHKPHRTLRRRLGAMCDTRKVRVEYDVRRSTVRISELTLDMTDLPDWHPDSDRYQGP